MRTGHMNNNPHPPTGPTNTAMQRQTTVTAHVKSKLLLLFAFVVQNMTISLTTV